MSFARSFALRAAGERGGARGSERAQAERPEPVPPAAAAGDKPAAGRGLAGPAEALTHGPLPYGPASLPREDGESAHPPGRLAAAPLRRQEGSAAAGDAVGRACLGENQHQAAAGFRLPGAAGPWPGRRARLRELTGTAVPGSPGKSAVGLGFRSVGTAVAVFPPPCPAPAACSARPSSCRAGQGLSYSSGPRRRERLKLRRPVRRAPLSAAPRRLPPGGRRVNVGMRAGPGALQPSALQGPRRVAAGAAQAFPGPRRFRSGARGVLSGFRRGGRQTNAFQAPAESAARFRLKSGSPKPSRQPS